MASTDGNTNDENKINIKILEINSVAYWKWDLQNDTCAICRNSLIDYCIECISNQSDYIDTNTHSTSNTISEQECTLSKGLCNHTFHQHCISRWLSTRYVCPLCNQDWEYEEISL